MKYVIKNCPAYWNQVYSCTRYTETSCQSCTDCVIKQVIDKCKRTLLINKGFENEFTLGKITFAKFILKDLDIQEVE